MEARAIRHARDDFAHVELLLDVPRQDSVQLRRIVERIFGRAKSTNRVLTREEILEVIG